MDPKEVLLRHFEKIVAGVFGGWLVFTIVSAVALQPAALKQNADLHSGLEAIETHMKNYDVKLDPLSDPTKDLKQQLDPSVVPGAEPFGAWLMHRRPSFVFEPVRGPALQYPKHSPPIEFHVTDKGRRKVSLAWKPNPENAFIKILRYDILRKDGEQGEYKVIDQVAGDKTEYTDTTVGARAKYWYRLTEHADTDRDDPVIAHDKTELDAKMLDLNAEDITDPVETPQDVYITIDGGNPADPTKNGDAAKGSIDCKVWRWHPGLNQFVSKGYHGVLEGKKVGTMDEHFLINHKPEKVDFGTDAELEEVTIQKRQVGKIPVPVDRVVARVKWPWGQEEEIVQGEYPPEIEAQRTKK